MTPQPTLSPNENDPNANRWGTTCPVCSREARELFVPLTTLDDEVRQLIVANAPGASGFDAVCARCVRLFESAKDQIEKDAAVRKDGSHVLSTPLRLDADPHYTGRGVTKSMSDNPGAYRAIYSGYHSYSGGK